MHALDRHQHEAAELTHVAARRCQAAAIEMVDHLARSSHGAPRPLGRLWRFQLDLIALVGEVSVVADRSYAVIEQSVALHRQFTQRLLEAADTRDDEHEPWNAEATLAGVTPLIPRERR